MIYMQIKPLIEVSKVSSQNNSEENIKHDTEIYRERYISPEQRQKIIDNNKINIIMITYNNGIPKSNKLVTK